MLSGRLIGGRYRIVEPIAAGGFGQVWRARDERLNVPVALKQIRIDPAASPAERAELIARAEREARHAAALRDEPNVVAVHDVVAEDGLPWVVMRLVDGGSLAHVLEQHPRLAPGHAAQITFGVLAALRAAHRIGIVHRDVKPANIMLTADARVLLADFGIAKRREDTTLTATGMVIGSLEYMAPERFGADPQANGTQSDLFSLGAVLFEMLEGRSPFRRPSVAATMAAVALEPHPPLQYAGPLTGLVEGLLAKRPEDRFTADEAIGALQALSQAPTSFVTQTQGPQSRPGRVRTRDRELDVIIQPVRREKKIAVIKAIRILTSLGLKEARDLVNDAPSVVLERVDHRTAGGAEVTLRSAGATVTIRETPGP